MAQRRPYISFTKDNQTKGFSFTTYAKVKKYMKEWLEESDDKKVGVYRQRRGQWGEYYEHWQFNAERKPVIVKQGWM